MVIEHSEALAVRAGAIDTPVGVAPIDLAGGMALPDDFLNVGAGQASLAKTKFRVICPGEALDAHASNPMRGASELEVVLRGEMEDGFERMGLFVVDPGVAASGETRKRGNCGVESWSWWENSACCGLYRVDTVNDSIFIHASAAVGTFKVQSWL